MDYKFKQGQKVRILDVASLDGRKEWAGRELTLKSQDAGGYGWEVPAWNVEDRDCPFRFRESEMALVGEGPTVTETVTVRRLEPGVYGRLRVAGLTKGTDKRVDVGFVGRWEIGSGTVSHCLTAPELRELARVALEIAEYLDGLD